MQRLLIFPLFILFLISCGGTDHNNTVQESTPDNSGKMIHASASRITSLSVTDQDIAKLVNRNTDFSVDFYHEISNSVDQNFVFSPFSISSGFSMVYAGAQGDTETQLMKVFHYLPQEEHHQILNALDQRLNSLSNLTKSDERHGTPFQLVVANAIWGQQDMPFKDSYLNVLAQQYGTGLQAVDFAKQSEQATNTINSWIADKTQGRITTLVPPDAISPQTRLVLTNAINFKGSWAIPFNMSETKSGTFILNDGQSVQVPMMHREQLRTTYLESDDFQAVQLPYIEGYVNMLIILPREGRFESVEQELSSDFFTTTLSHMETYDVDLSMPRFAIETDLSLSNYLKEMGVIDSFNETKANFNGIVDQSGLFVSDAFHQSTILVDEQGTEATAATVAAMAENALEQAEMKINRPFIFVIMDQETRSILFLGRVMNPTQ